MERSLACLKNVFSKTAMLEMKPCLFLCVGKEQQLVRNSEQNKVLSNEKIIHLYMYPVLMINTSDTSGPSKA